MTALPAPPVPSPLEVPAPFPGFRRPSYTMVPDELFDELLPELSGAELKVLLFVVRRTFGFKRDADAISLAQMLHGVTTREGRVLHRGVGLSKPTLLGALRSLQEKGVLRAARRRSAVKGNEPTVYALRFAECADHPAPARPDRAGAVAAARPPLAKKVAQGDGQAALPSPWAKNLPPQQTGPRQTHGQHHPQTPSAPLEPLEGTLAPASPSFQEPTGAGDDDDDALQLLLSRGVTRRIAQELVLTHSGEAIEQQVAWQAHRPKATSPAGALVQAIRDAWPPPPAWREAQERAAVVARQAEAERQRQEEAAARRRAKRHEPTAAEIAARKAELLAELAAAGGVS
jgi:Bacteriophage replication protein O